MAKSTKGKPRGAKPPRRSRWRWVILVVLLLFINAGVGVGVWVYNIWQTLPPVHELKHWRPDEPLRIYGANGELLQVVGPQVRYAVPLDQIPKQLQAAFIAAENSKFWSDNPIYYPVSFPGIIRAALVDVVHMAPVQGASTIPEQVARNFYLTPQKTVTRKVAEILLAYKLAEHFSKAQILELYLNKIYLGQGAYGVQAAARIYYGKDVGQLTLGEMATLAGLPPAPSYLNPIINPELAKKRRDYVLRRMRNLGYITDAEAEAAMARPMEASYHAPGSNVAPYATDWIRNWLTQQFGPDFTYRTGLKVYTTIVPKDQRAANEAIAYGLENYDMGLDSLDPKAYRGPVARLDSAGMQAALAGKRPSQLPPHDPANLRWGVVLSANPQEAVVALEGEQNVTLTLRDVAWARPRVGAPKPTAVNQVLQPGDLIWLRRYVNAVTAGAGQVWGANVWSSPGPHAGWQLTQIPQVQGALVSLDSRTGAIRALVGGFSYELSHFNRAIDAYRQPGSGFKPFVYAAAMDGAALAAAGNSRYLTPVSMIPNTPLSITLPTGQVYQPTNYDNEFSDTPVPVWNDLAQSKNVPSVRILMDVGIPYAVQYVQRFGFPPKQIPAVPSMVLGAGDFSPLQIARGYAVFSSGGFLPKPYLITKIVNSRGTQVSLLDCPLGYAPPPRETVVPPGVAYLMTQMMQRVIQQGTGVAAQSLGRNDLAGKTGTTNHETNAWFMGYNPQIVTTVWVGYDDNRGMGRWAAGAREALPIWIHYMRTALAGTPDVGFFRPPDVVQAQVDPTTGALVDSGGQTFDFLAGYLPPRAPMTLTNNPVVNGAKQFINEIEKLF